ncbi:hypothetical protein Tco_0175552 [Tanacetum coccineum]
MSSSTYQYQSSQYFSPVNCFDFDDEFEPLFGSHDYALGQGSGGPSVSVQDDSSVKEVSTVRTRKQFQLLVLSEKHVSTASIVREAVNTASCVRYRIMKDFCSRIIEDLEQKGAHTDLKLFLGKLIVDMFNHLHAPLRGSVSLLLLIFITTASLYFYCLDSFFLIVRHGGQFEYWKAGLVVVVQEIHKSREALKIVSFMEKFL